MKFSKARAGLLAVLVVASAVLAHSAVSYNNANKILDSLYRFDTYEVFLKKARSLESVMSEEAYQSVSPDNMNNLVTYRRLTALPMSYRIVDSSVSPISGEVTIYFNILADTVDPSRLFLLRANTGFLKIKKLDRWELLSL